MRHRWYSILMIAALPMHALAVIFYWESPAPPLTADSCDGTGQMPDGATVQILWDNDDNGPDANDQLPPLCDFPPACEGGPDGTVNFNQFTGGAYFESPNWLCTTLPPEPHHYYLRVCMSELHWLSAVLTVTFTPNEEFGPDELNFMCEDFGCGFACPPPPAPQTVTASDTLCTGVQVSWTYPDTVTGLDQFLIYRDLECIAIITDVLQRTYFDATTSLDPASYGVVARRTCENGNTGFSARISDNGVCLPMPPAALNISASDTHPFYVEVTWTYASNLGLNHWRILRDGELLGLVPGGGDPGPRSFLNWFPPEGRYFYDVHAYSIDCGEGISTGGDSGGIAPQTAGELHNSLITSYALHPAFPNPFNAETLIRFDLPQASLVQLQVFDLTGREAAVLADGVRERGTHTLKFSGAHLSTGIYFVRMAAGNYVQTQKILLLK